MSMTHLTILVEARRSTGDQKSCHSTLTWLPRYRLVRTRSLRVEWTIDYLELIVYVPRGGWVSHLSHKLSLEHTHFYL